MCVCMKEMSLRLFEGSHEKEANLRETWGEWLMREKKKRKRKRRKEGKYKSEQASIYF